MTIRELIEIADQGYSDSLISQYYDDPDGNHGDTLARFIAFEISETISEEDVDSLQLTQAITLMETAKREIQGVIDALTEAL